MNEVITIPFNLETEVKIARAMEESGMTRDEVIAEAISLFLSKMGF